MKQIILASGSPRRRELLLQIGIEPVVQPSTVEEVLHTTVPEEAVIELSLQKAKDVAASVSKGIVLGADTVVSIDGRILGKPSDKTEAAEMIRRLQGRSHAVYTGITLILKEGTMVKEKSFYEKTEVFVYPMTEAEIQSYIETGESLDKAGAYGIQGAFAAFIRRIEGDYANVVGLPVGRVYQELKGMEKIDD